MTQNTAEKLSPNQSGQLHREQRKLDPHTAGSDAPGRSRLIAAAGIFQRFGLVWALLLIALLGVTATTQSANKLFWWDELASYDIAQLPHADDVWSFFRAGLDTPSPVPTLIVQAELQSVGKSEVRARLPFELGFLAMCFGLYAIVSRRYSAGYALAALLFPALAGVFYYASEMRTYGLVLGSITCALCCWQALGFTVRSRLVHWITVAGLFTGLAFAILCHVFAIFVLIPFALGQATRDWQQKKINFAAWAAMLLAPLCILVEVPGLRAAHRMYAGLFWSKPGSGQILFSYNYAVGIGWLVAVLIVVLAWPAIIRTSSRLTGPAFEQARDRGFSLPEWTLITTLALLPMYAWPLSHLLGVYVPRYVLPLTIGLALLIVGGTAEALKRNRIAGVVLAAAFLVVFFQARRELVFGILHRHAPLYARFDQQPWIQALERSSLPVVAPNTPIYTQMQHYAPPQLEQRLYYTLHTPAAIRPAEDLDAELSMKLFSSRLPLRVEEFSSFIARHPSFLLVVKSPLDPGRTGNLTVQPMGSYNGGELFNYAQFFVYRIDVAAASPKFSVFTASGVQP